MLEDAYSHHVWATLQLIDACLVLDPEQVEASSPGTYGSVLDTFRHLVAADSWYLFRLSGERTSRIEDEEERMSLPELRVAMEAAGEGWSQVVAGDPDPDALIGSPADDGSEELWPTSIRVAQALHHGTDHRSQICTTLTTLGVEPPPIDVWDFGWQAGRMVKGPAPS